MPPIRTTTDTKTQIPTAAISLSLFTSFEPSIILYCFKIEFLFAKEISIKFTWADRVWTVCANSTWLKQWNDWNENWSRLKRCVSYARAHPVRISLYKIQAKLPGEIQNTTKLDRTHWMIVVLSGRLLCTVPSTESSVRSPERRPIFVVNRNYFRLFLSLSVALPIWILFYYFYLSVECFREYCVRSFDCGLCSSSFVSISAAEAAAAATF